MATHYLKQMDGGKWMEVITVPTGENEETVVDAIIHDKKPEIDGELLYEKPLN